MSECSINLSSAMYEDLDSDPLLSKLHEQQSEGVMLGGVLLKAPIAEGGMGTVYKAWHTRLNIPVAVKILKRGCEANLPLFLREARLTVSLEHPNLVRIYDINAEHGHGLHYMIMEYVEGCSAYQLLERQLKKNCRPLTEVSVLDIALATARALGVAHAHDIVHRDVKSDNILVRSKDGMVKLADLGLAGKFRVSSGGQSRARHTSMSGTIGFISPEVVSGEEVTPAADIYALGATMYELLTGTLPHGSPIDETYYSRQLHEAPIDPRERQCELNDDVVEFINRCLARDPADRFQDGSDAAAALEPLLAAISGQRRCVGGSEQPRKPVVLCIDDDAQILELERDTLEAENFTPVCISNPVEALNKIATIRPDVIVIDLNMPGMSGIELCQRIRSIEGFSDIGVIMLSGENDNSLIDTAFRKGITDYLHKPLNLQELVVRLTLLAQLRAANRQKKMLENQLLNLKRVPSRARFKSAGQRREANLALVK